MVGRGEGPPGDIRGPHVPHPAEDPRVLRVRLREPVPVPAPAQVRTAHAAAGPRNRYLQFSRWIEDAETEPGPVEGLSKLVRRTLGLTERLAAAEAEGIRVTVLTSDPEDPHMRCGPRVRVIRVRLVPTHASGAAAQRHDRRRLSRSHESPGRPAKTRVGRCRPARRTVGPARVATAATVATASRHA